LSDKNWAILSADKIGRLLHDTQQIFVGQFCRQIKLADFAVRLTSTLLLVKIYYYLQYNQDDTAIMSKIAPSSTTTDFSLSQVFLTVGKNSCQKYHNALAVTSIF